MRLVALVCVCLRLCLGFGLLARVGWGCSIDLVWFAGVRFLLVLLVFFLVGWGLLSQVCRLRSFRILFRFVVGVVVFVWGCLGFLRLCFVVWGLWLRIGHLGGLRSGLLWCALLYCWPRLGR